MVIYYRKCPLLHVNCLPVTKFGPFRRLPAAATLCSAGFLFWLFIFQQPLFLRWVSVFFLWFCFSDASPTIYSAKTTVKPSFRVSCGFTSSPSLPASGNDSETVAQSAVLLSGPSSHASEPAIPATGLVFPPALFDQLVPRVAAEVTRQLQRAPLLPAVQEPQVPSPAALPSLARTTAVQQLTTKVPVASSSPVGNPCGPGYSSGTFCSLFIGR